MTTLATVPTITLPALEARQHFLEYRRAVRARHTDEDQALMRGYRALSHGHRVLDIRAAIAHGGVHGDGRAHGLPRLAFARAGAARCWVRVYMHGGVLFTTNENGYWRRVAHAERTRLPEDTLPRWIAPPHQPSVVDGAALIPVVPPGLRPLDHLDNYRLLWEADWSPIPRAGDPMLLKPLGCGLAVVVATWDMTPLEAAVLGWRR